MSRVFSLIFAAVLTCAATLPVAAQYSNTSSVLGGGAGSGTGGGGVRPTPGSNPDSGYIGALGGRNTGGGGTGGGNGGGTVDVPEIDVTRGLASGAGLLAALALAWELQRRRRRT